MTTQLQTDPFASSDTIEFYVDTDKTVDLGVGFRLEQIPVRYLNDADYDILIGHAYAAYQAFRGRGRLTQLVVSSSKGLIKQHVHAFVSRALSNPDENRLISIGYLRSLPPGQIPVAIRAIIDGNKDQFKEVLELLPAAIREPLSKIGKGSGQKLKDIFASATNLNQLVDELTNALKDFSMADIDESEDEAETGDTLDVVMGNPPRVVGQIGLMKRIEDDVEKTELELLPELEAALDPETKADQPGEFKSYTTFDKPIGF